MSARKPDPAVVAWDRIQAADKAWATIEDERNEVEGKACEAGLKVQWPIVCIGGYGCMSMTEVRHAIRGLPKDAAAKAVEAMRTALAARQQQRRKAGLVPFDVAYKRADREWRAAMRAMATTRATTVAGVIAKLKIIEIEIRDGRTGFGEGIIASAIKDLSRISRRAR